MRVCSSFFLFVLWIYCSAANAEAWLPAYALPGSRVDIDQESVVRNGVLVSWREREVMAEPAIDDPSLRAIRELQLRKQADCRKRQMKILSRAAFAEDDGLLAYEGKRPGRVMGRAFSSLPAAERNNVESLCGRFGIRQVPAGETSR